MSLKRKSDNFSKLERPSKSTGGYFEREIFFINFYSNVSFVYSFEILDNFDKYFSENKNIEITDKLSLSKKRSNFMS